MSKWLLLSAVLMVALAIVFCTVGGEPPVPPECTQAGQTWTSPKDGMVLSCIPAGEFLMGSEDGADNEKPIHIIHLDAYWMDQTEVTYAQYQQFMADENYNGDPLQPCGDGDDHPVACVTWSDAQAYCTWAGRRLPTEAEWEKASRGGLEGMVYPWGNDDPVCTPGAENGAQLVSCDGNTVEVKTFASNGYGLFDMAGNVWEWVFDWWGGDYYNAYEPNSWPPNPEGPATGDYRVVRGGSWGYAEWDMSVARRWSDYNGYADLDGGFRCAHSP